MSSESGYKPLWALDQVLADLMRWQFGALLAERAKWQGAEPHAVSLAVQDYRRRILGACLRHAGLDPGSLVGVKGDAAAWELILVEEFLKRLEQIAPMGEAREALTRFAHGQYFKYSRRVAFLMQLDKRLPCAYGQAAGN